MKTVLSIIKNIANIKQKPSFVTFFVTWRCNSRCVMCDVWKKQEKNALTLEEIEKIFKQLKGIGAIRISGGEPFLRGDLAEIINIIDKTASPNLIHITSNGFLTDKIIADVMNINSPEKLHIKISIDGMEERHDKVRGVAGAYRNAMNTIKELAELKESKKFYLGVNQTIVGPEGMKDYFELSRILKGLGVMVHPVLAYVNTTALYNERDSVKAKPSFSPYGNFDKKELAVFIKKLIKETGSFGDFKEALTKKYYLKGLYNRVIEGKNKPKPLCAALKSHLRILPNGDVPVCLYNSTIVGNLREKNLKELWFGKDKKVEESRQWVKKCSGCWAGCETIVSAIYSGDIVKGLF